MAAELTNPAVELMRSVMTELNGLDDAPTDLPITDDFVFEDRRSSGGAGFGRVDATDWISMIASTWDVSEGGPHYSIPEVLAVRGDRLAAIVVNVDYGNGNVAEHAHCLQLDPTLRLFQRQWDFDLSDVASAIAELDRAHVEIGLGRPSSRPR